MPLGAAGMGVKPCVIFSGGFFLPPKTMSQYLSFLVVLPTIKFNKQKKKKKFDGY